MKFLLLSDKNDYMVTRVKNETTDFYCTNDISEFLSRTADICFIDFGTVCSIYSLCIGESSWELRQLVKHIEENQNTKYYFCLTMPSDSYNEYDEIWMLSNVIKVTYFEWAKADAIKRIIKGKYVKPADFDKELIY